MPFDSSTLLGFMISLVIQTADVYCLAICGYPNICFLIGGCWLWKTIVMDIANDLSYFNGGDEMSTKDCIKKKEFLCNIVQNIADAKQLSKIVRFYQFNRFDVRWEASKC